MINSKRDLVVYRLARAHETFDDAQLLADNNKWNSAINRLYYAAFYAISALILSKNLDSHTHNGVKSKFSELFVKTGIVDKEYGKIYSQLFTWRQKGDYDDLFDFDKETVFPYIEKVKALISEVEKIIG
ncbi:HEPN domain-containing protein [Algoriphagus sp.]|uniref:HEPN domain-containing protein n=1 Tax=Algoriphagus sp. TaxID=1872435 RepID=UPI00328473D1